MDPLREKYGAKDENEDSLGKEKEGVLLPDHSVLMKNLLDLAQKTSVVLERARLQREKRLK